jgi:hypothetical protein
MTSGVTMLQMFQPGIAFMAAQLLGNATLMEVRYMGQYAPDLSRFFATNAECTATLAVKRGQTGWSAAACCLGMLLLHPMQQQQQQQQHHPVKCRTGSAALIEGCFDVHICHQSVCSVTVTGGPLLLCCLDAMLLLHLAQQQQQQQQQQQPWRPNLCSVPFSG